MRRRRAIIFEDEASIIALFEKVLSKRGYEIMSFREPVECPVYENNESKCRKEYPCSDVVITDLRLPQMSGVQLLKRQAAGGCRLPLGNKALVTAYLDEESRAAVEELGCSYLGKPFSIADLSAWLDACEKRLDLSVPVALRRKEKRRPVRLDLRYHIASMSQDREAMVIDISASGFCLKAYHDFGKEQTIQVMTVLPNSCTTGVVRWTKKDADGYILAGFACG